MSHSKHVNIVAFDHDGYAYGFTSEEAFLAWLEPQTVAELDAVYDRNGGRLEISQSGQQWAVESSGQETTEVLVTRLRMHDEKFGRSDPDDGISLSQRLDLLLKGRHLRKC